MGAQEDDQLSVQSSVSHPTPRHGEGDEGGDGPDEGHEEEEDRDHFRQGDEGGGADEGHEVSWTSGSALYAPACASSSCVGVSALVSSMGRMRDQCTHVPE